MKILETNIEDACDFAMRDHPDKFYYHVDRAVKDAERWTTLRNYKYRLACEGEEEFLSKCFGDVSKAELALAKIRLDTSEILEK